MTASILYLNVVLHLNHEKCVGNESHAVPIKHIGGGIWRERVNRGWWDAGVKRIREGGRQ